MTNNKTEYPRLSWEAVCARRLDRHALSTPMQDANPARIVQQMCGAHAQVITAAELSIALRLAGVTRQDIRQALWDEHSLIKTYGPRGTVHLLPSQDLPMWAGALSATPYGQNRDPRSALLNPEQLEAVIAAIAIILEDAELTTDELTAALVDRLGAWAGELVMPAFQSMWPRWRMAQSTAGMRGALCFGPNRGRQVTFTSPRRWLPGFQPADEQTALAGLVRHYLYAYGPATPQQFAKWLASPRRWTAELFESLSNQLEQVDLQGSPAWVVAGDTGAPTPAPQSARLLPYFDAYAVGCHPRELLYPGQAAERALTGGQAGNFPVLLIGGIVAGVWNQRRSGKRIEITVEPLVELNTEQRLEIDNQVKRIGEFLEGDPGWVIGSVTTGGHA